MRKILFRGKRKDNGEWIYWNIYGELCRLSGKRERLAISKTAGEHYYHYIYQIRQLIIPETIGQYTGLTDKNGKKIFDGDIIKALSDSGNTSCITSVGIGNCKETSDDGTTAIAVYTTYFSDGYYVLPTNKKYKNRTEVIGNIHDNPELLES